MCSYLNLSIRASPIRSRCFSGPPLEHLPRPLHTPAAALSRSRARSLRDLSRAWRVAEALQVGMCGINTGVISAATAPFGGIKQSGFGREGGRAGLDEYLQTK